MTLDCLIHSLHFELNFKLNILLLEIWDVCCTFLLHHRSDVLKKMTEISKPNEPQE